MAVVVNGNIIKEVGSYNAVSRWNRSYNNAPRLTLFLMN